MTEQAIIAINKPRASQRTAGWQAGDIWTTRGKENRSDGFQFKAFGGEEAALEGVEDLVEDGAEVGEEFADAVAIPGAYEVYLLGVARFYHLAFEEVVVVELAVGRVVRVDVELRGVGADAGLLRVLEAAHVVVVLEDIVEGRVLVHEDVDGLVADELHLLARLLPHLLPGHRHDLAALPLPRRHPVVEVPAHCDLLQLHVHLSQQVVGRDLLVHIAQQPALPQQLEAEVLGLGVAGLGEEDARDCLVELQLEVLFEEVVVVIAVVEALEGAVEVVEGEGVAAVLVEDEAGEGEGAVDERARPHLLHRLVQRLHLLLHGPVRVDLLVHALRQLEGAAQQLHGALVRAPLPPPHLHRHQRGEVAGLDLGEPADVQQGGGAVAQQPRGVQRALGRELDRRPRRLLHDAVPAVREGQPWHLLQPLQLGRLDELAHAEGGELALVGLRRFAPPLYAAHDVWKVIMFEQSEPDSVKDQLSLRSLKTVISPKLSGFCCSSLTSPC